LSSTLHRPLLTDTHCHLTAAQFDADRDEVIARAQAAGVARMVTIGTNLADAEAVVALAARHPSVHAAVGIHPNEAADLPLDWLERVRALAGRPRVVAIGEIGLDYYWQRAPETVQKSVLRQQLDLAAELGLPVIIHDREAHDDLRAELRDWALRRVPGTPLAGRPFLGVLHSFSGDLSMAEEACAWGFVLGLAGPVTFQNARGLQALVRHLPPERVVVETDSPYLAPHPYRGRRNEPAYVALVAAKLAELWGMAPEQVAATTTDTACRLFGLSPTATDTEPSS
ncbi:MAG: TatD family hydrolase, partial [Caldilineales bacterium]|nr:TatD family hydrolase [Caldilineales bacterium]